METHIKNACIIVIHFNTQKMESNIVLVNAQNKQLLTMNRRNAIWNNIFVPKK